MKPQPILAPRPRRLLSQSQRLAWLRLIRSENIGPVTFRDLLNEYGGAQAALDALPSLSRHGGRLAGQMGGRKSLRICSQAEAERELGAALAASAQLVAIDEPGYPQLLATIDAPPPLLYIKGQAALADKPIIAIVGARDASAAGRKIAATMAAGLGAAGIAVASGLARGIDTAAHQGALATGTIAIVAGGIDVAYPPENAGLQASIGSHGLLVAECAPGLEPRGTDFPRRNRIISGMSMGVLVVEAAQRSGSRITADYAAAQGRRVFAVPGNPLDARASGTNQLLKNGAGVVTEAADILRDLGLLAGSAITRLSEPGPESEAESGPETSASLNAGSAVPHPAASDWGQPMELAKSDRARVMEALGPAPVSLDELIRASGLPARQVRIVLLELDIAGRLDRSGGQLVALKL